MMELIASNPAPIGLLIILVFVASLVILSGYRSRKHAKRLAADPEYQRLIEAHERNQIEAREQARVKREMCNHTVTDEDSFEGHIYCHQCGASSK